MVNPLGPRIAKYTAAKAGHDVVLSMKQSLKLAVRFVQGSGKGMSGIYAKAQAKKDARHDVSTAVKKLWQDRGIDRSPDFKYLGSILTKVIKLIPEDQKKKLEKQEYRAALFDEAWKASIGNKKGIVLLRTIERITGDGTKKLRLGMRRAFERGELAEFRTAKSLVRLLNEVKNCPNQPGCSERVPRSGSLIDLFQKNTESLGPCHALLSSFPHIGLPLGLVLLGKIDPPSSGKKELESLNPFTGGRAGEIDPKLSKEDIRFEVCLALADQYLGKLSLSDERKKEFGAAIESAESVKTVVRNLQDAYFESLIEYDKSNGSVATEVGLALKWFLDPMSAARDIAHAVVDEVLAELPARLARMDITLESEDEYTALLAAARNKIRTVQPSWISDELMDEAVQEECWKAIIGTQEKAPAQPGQQEAATKQDKLGNVSSRQMQAALTSVRNLPGELISGPQLLRLVEDHFEVFSGPVWLHTEARVSLPEYLGLANAIHVLEMLIDKDEYTKEDTELLLSTLKEQNVPDPRMRGFSFSGSPETPSTFDLEKPNETRSRMIEAVHDRYFSGAANLYRERKQFDAEYQAASSAADKIEALKLGMTLLLEETKLEKDRVVAMLEDLALLRPVRVRESLV